MQRYVIVVTGRVQGVYFRDTARKVATDLGIVGFARNEPDGSVRLEAEGDKKALQQFLAWCRTGPAHATVKTISFTKHAPSNATGFQIY